MSEVARKLDVRPGAVDHWEAGRNGMAMKNRKKLAKLYGCTEDELLEGTQ